MHPLVVLLAIFVFTFIAGFGWRTGSVMARVFWRLLVHQRNTTRSLQSAQDASESHRIKTHEADKSARGPSGQTPFFR